MMHGFLVHGAWLRVPPKGMNMTQNLLVMSLILTPLLCLQNDSASQGFRYQELKTGLIFRRIPHFFKKFPRK